MSSQDNNNDNDNNNNNNSEPKKRSPSPRKKTITSEIEDFFRENRRMIRELERMNKLLDGEDLDNISTRNAILSAAEEPTEDVQEEGCDSESNNNNNNNNNPKIQKRKRESPTKELQSS